jgi:hypothetical protein
VVALAGVVVNDSLVLVSFMNQHRDDGLPLHKAVVRAGVARFRPILLTSLTTAAGITPLMLERSVQAQFLIPMAVALAFGVLFSTFITLGLVPALYVILEDIQRLFRWAWGSEPDAEEYAHDGAALAGQTPPMRPVSEGGTSPAESPSYAEISYGGTSQPLRALRPQKDEPSGD